MERKTVFILVLIIIVLIGIGYFSDEIRGFFGFPKTEIPKGIFKGRDSEGLKDYKEGNKSSLSVNNEGSVNDGDREYIESTASKDNLPGDLYSAECGFYFEDYGVCGGVCPSGTCVSERRSCYCKK